MKVSLISQSIYDRLKSMSKVKELNFSHDEFKIYLELVDHVNNNVAADQFIIGNGYLVEHYSMHPIFVPLINPWWLSADGTQNTKNLILRQDNKKLPKECTPNFITELNNKIDKAFKTNTVHRKLNEIRGMMVFDPSKYELYNWGFFLKVPKELKTKLVNGDDTPELGIYTKMDTFEEFKVHPNLPAGCWPIPIYGVMATCIWDQSDWSRDIREHLDYYIDSLITKGLQ